MGPILSLYLLFPPPRDSLDDRLEYFLKIEAYTFTKFKLNDLLTWLIDIYHTSPNIHQHIQREITQRTLCRYIDDTASGLALGDEETALRSLKVRVNHMMVQIFHITTGAPKSLLSIASQMVRLKHLTIGHSEKAHSVALIEQLEALSKSCISLQTLEFYGAGFGDQYVQYLNQIWGLFPEVRITRLIFMNPVGNCDLQNLCFPANLLAFELSYSENIRFGNLCATLGAPVIDENAISENLNKLAFSNSFVRLKIDILNSLEGEPVRKSPVLSF
ncbi:hypothetical protein TWF481_002787 [Arthrobotrys musiformis]|uniref:Uncharacterized protein n=1 Tax=Arthrobotrys musiformis TaxID=47236 RepID=A0AAV9VR74_9PEZI